jgi:hypothetical protein
MSVAAGLWGVLQGEAWDDLRAPASAIPIRGQTGDPDTDADGSLLFDAGTVEQIAIIYQMPHSWDSTGIRPHIHWQKTSDAAGDVVWQMRYRVWNNNDIVPDFGAWTTATIRSQTIAADQTTLIDGWAEIDMAGKRGSCLVNMQIRRKADDAADTYAADCKFWEADIHYRRFGLGSEKEYPGA